MSSSNKVTEKGIFPFNVIDVFNVVLDVEHYPEFLPWCKSIKIILKEQNTIIADSIISFKGIEAFYTSIITYNTPNEINSGYINVYSDKGAFKLLVNYWKFIPQSNNSTLIEFDIDFELKSFFMQSIVNIMYKTAQKKIVESFYKRMHDKNDSSKIKF